MEITGANVQGVADLETNETAAENAGENVQGAADLEADNYIPNPNFTESENESAGDSDDDSGGDIGNAADNTANADESDENEEQSAPPATQQEQSAEERRYQAQQRRARELAEAKKLEQLRVDEVYRKAYAGQVNPYTGRPINSEADFKEYEKAHLEERRKKELEEAGISTDTINAVINNHPAIVQAREAIERAEKLEQQAAATARKNEIDAQLKIISSFDPTVKSVDDIGKNEKAGEILELVKKGVTLSDAYKLANLDKIAAKAASAAAQKAINQSTGKAHLNKTTQASKAVSVPPDVLEVYREMMPGLSDSEYAKHYEKIEK